MDDISVSYTTGTGDRLIRWTVKRQPANTRHTPFCELCNHTVQPGELMVTTTVMRDGVSEDVHAECAVTFCLADECEDGEYNSLVRALAVHGVSPSNELV